MKYFVVAGFVGMACFALLGCSSSSKSLPEPKHPSTHCQAQLVGFAPDFVPADISEPAFERALTSTPVRLDASDMVDGKLLDVDGISYGYYSLYTGRRVIVMATVARRSEPGKKDFASEKFHGRPERIVYFIVKTNAAIPGHAGSHLIEFTYPFDLPGKIPFYIGDIWYLVFGTDGTFVSMFPARTSGSDIRIASSRPSPGQTATNGKSTRFRGK